MDLKFKSQLHAWKVAKTGKKNEQGKEERMIKTLNKNERISNNHRANTSRDYLIHSCLFLHKKR